MKIASSLSFGCTVSLASFLTPALAHAADAHATPAAAETAQASAEVPGAHEATHEEEHAEEHARIRVGLDLVLGFGKTAFFKTEPTQALELQPRYTLADHTKVSSQSFIAFGSYSLSPNFGVGLRVPFSFASFTPEGAPAKSSNALGAIELEAEYERHVSHAAKVFAVLGISLPTAQGAEFPEAVAAGGGENGETGEPIDVNGVNRNSVNRAAAASRGYEENALFEPKRFGINPKIGADFHAGKATLAGYVKVENLISTGDAHHSYIGEVIPAVRVGYRVHSMIEPGVRAWAPIVFAGAEAGAEKYSVVVEPQVGFHFGPIHPTVGVLLPVAGALSDPYFLGVRIAAVAAF